MDDTILADIKRKKFICAMLALIVTFMSFNELDHSSVRYPVLPPIERLEDMDDIFKAIVILDQNLTAQILAADEYPADSTGKSEVCFRRKLE